jgi:hypothetical protein
MNLKGREIKEMSDDIIINVTQWMRENQKNIEPDMDRHERECLAYLGMLMYKLFLIGETSHKWTPSFKKIMKQLPKGLKELVR